MKPLVFKPVVRPAALALLACLVALSVSACRDTSRPIRRLPDGGGGDGGARGGVPTTVRAIQQEDGVGLGDRVYIEEAVVTALVPNQEGQPTHLYIQDPVDAGESWNGLYVYRGGGASPVPDGIEVGSRLALSGDIDEFRNSTQVAGEVEITALDGTADPVVLEGTPVASLASLAEGEEYEGVLVEVSGVGVVQGVNDFGEFVVSDGTAQLIVDDFIFAHEPEVGDCFATLRGVMTENDFGDGNRPIQPRLEGDLVPDAESCPEAPEPVTVREIQEQVEQADGINEGDTVAVEAAVVTAVVPNGDGDPVHFFIQDPISSAESWNGIYVYRGGEASPLPGDLVVGSIVDVLGTVGSFRNATQLEGVQFTLQDGSADPVVSVDPPLADLASVADGEEYEGLLVEVSDLEVVEDVASRGNGEFVVSDGTTQLVIDDLIFAHEPAVGDCFATLRGPMSEYDFGDGDRPLLLRSADDLVPDGQCSSAAAE